LGSSTSYTWLLGDGTVVSDPGSFTHVYTTPGTYTVQLIVQDSLSCNQLDTTTFVLTYAAGFSSGFAVDYTGCVPVTAEFTNDYPDAEFYTWDFGDGNTGSGLNPTHVYNASGTYTVTLTTENCGATETVSAAVDVPVDPIAFFSDEPYAAIINTPVTFTNLSEFASSYLWEFSDGTNSAAVNAVHSFAAAGVYEVCLTARNNFGCEDQYCRSIEIEFDGLIDVPTAFTPNGDGVNDRFLVQGFGAEEFQLRIFNRWGEIVYESRDLFEGWDGTFRGKPQEMDAYAYTLRVRFANNRVEERQGNVTLLR
jgi:gliding motility-associated-like protein